MVSKLIKFHTPNYNLNPHSLILLGRLSTLMPSLVPALYRIAEKLAKVEKLLAILAT